MAKTLAVAALLLLALGAVAAAAEEDACPELPVFITTKDGVAKLATRWACNLVKSWKKGDSSYVVNEYAPDGTAELAGDTGAQLLPTVSDTRATTTALIKAYFDDFFLPGQPLPELVGYKARVLADNVVTLAGDWTYTKKDDRAKKTKARVTFVWRRFDKVTVGGKELTNHWLIVEMHSSKFPQIYCTGAAASAAAKTQGAGRKMLAAAA